MTKFALILALLTSVCSWSQGAIAPIKHAAPQLPENLTIPDDGVRVSVLGYHDLAENLPETAMRIHTSKFRKQMETIRLLGIKVITHAEFSAWKKGEVQIPDKAMLITFDDGWKSVYTDAYPVLKELGFPFTIFLYKNYVDGGGKALTTAMIQEMAANGCTIGSHSVDHPYPLTVKNSRKKGPTVYDAYLRKEMGESKSFLEAKFPGKITSYAYPGGFFTEEMFKLGDELGYTEMFTVLPGKTKRSLPNQMLPRYIVLGNYDRVFEMATNFRESKNGADLAAVSTPGAIQTTPFPVTPEAGAIINTRLPEISADLSTVENLNPASLSMKVAGFGEVPATFSDTTKKFSWLINRPLRQPSCQVAVTWKDSAGKSPETPLRWSFQIDRESAYLPDGE